MPKNLAAQFHDEVITHKVDLLQYSESVRQAVLGFLNSLQSDLASQIAAGDLSPARLARAEALIRQSQATIGTAYKQIAASADASFSDLAQLEGKFTKRMMSDVMQSDLGSIALTPANLKVLASDALIQGSPARDWWAKQDRDTRLRFAQQVRLGVAQGETNDQIVKRIIGSKTGRKIPITNPKTGKTVLVDEFSRGILDISKREATALVRTAVQTISNQVLIETYRENQDVLKGVQWLATLDPRTCPTCRPRDGAAWDFEGNPLPQSPVQNLPYSVPPIHYNCRCVLIPITKSWNELIHEEHGPKNEVSPDQAQERLDEAETTDPGKNQAASPIPTQRMNLGKGGPSLVKQMAKAVEPVEVHPADLIGMTDTLDYSKVESAIHSGSDSGIIAVRKQGKLYVVQGQEKVAAAVYRNQGESPIKIVDAPAAATFTGDLQAAPEIPPAGKSKVGAVFGGETPPISTRASMDGQISSTTSYSDWLKTKPEAFQDEVLGPTKANLWRQGKITLTDMVDPTGRPLTIDELTAKAFPAAAESLPEMSPAFEDYSSSELVRLVAAAGLTAAQVRLVLFSLGIDVTDSVLYKNMLKAGTLLPLLVPEAQQELQQKVDAVKSGKIRAGSPPDR